MKKVLFFLLLALPFLLQSCGGHNHSGGDIPPLVLDNGQPWQANPETSSGIAEMQTILAKYEGKTADDTSRESLQEELEAAFQGIFKACTMTGEGHNQLHNYLLPMKPLFEKIGEGPATESEAAISQLKQHLSTYQTYFQ
ncbi:MAG: hypothetical protein IT258_18075 [Saprospiraceae bacterium]|nr:hypothetical protein [Saprospiraceae bacterium]